MEKKVNFTKADPMQVFGTGLVGVVVTTYAELVKTFGEPIVYGEFDSDGKVSVEWVIAFEDGTIASIYDWKQYELGTPMGEYDWHIGGKDDTAVQLVKDVLGL